MRRAESLINHLPYCSWRVYSYRSVRHNVVAKGNFMKKLLTIADFMALYRVSRSTVYRLFAKGSLTPVKIGSATRIHSDEAANWLAGLMAGRT